MSIYETELFKTQGSFTDNAHMVHEIYTVRCRSCQNYEEVKAYDSLDAVQYFETCGWTYRRQDNMAKCPECSTGGR